jgi:hypothetical protein
VYSQSTSIPVKFSIAGVVVLPTAAAELSLCSPKRSLPIPPIPPLFLTPPSFLILILRLCPSPFRLSLVAENFLRCCRLWFERRPHKSTIVVVGIAVVAVLSVFFRIRLVDIDDIVVNRLRQTATGQLVPTVRFLT